MADGKDAVHVTAEDQRAFLRAWRMRRPEAPPRAPRIAWLVVALLHALFLVGLRLAMTPPPFDLRGARDDPVIEVRFIPSEAELDAQPQPQLPVRAEPVAPRGEAALPDAPAPAIAAAAATQTAAGARDPRLARDTQVQVREETPRLRLFNPDGSLHLSQQTVDAADAKPRPLYQGRAKTAPRFMRHESPIEYAPTRFEADWVPRDETIVGEFFRKATVERIFKTPWGDKVKCAWILVLGGCSFGSAPTPLADAPPRPGMSNPVPPPPPPGPPPPIAPYPETSLRSAPE